MATKTRPPLGLLPKEKKAVREFITRVRAAYGDKIQRAPPCLDPKREKIGRNIPT